MYHHGAWHAHAGPACIAVRCHPYRQCRYHVYTATIKAAICAMCACVAFTSSGCAATGLIFLLSAFGICRCMLRHDGAELPDPGLTEHKLCMASTLAHGSFSVSHAGHHHHVAHDVIASHMSWGIDARACWLALVSKHVAVTSSWHGCTLHAGWHGTRVVDTYMCSTHIDMEGGIRCVEGIVPCKGGALRACSAVCRPSNGHFECA